MTHVINVNKDITAINAQWGKTKMYAKWMNEKIENITRKIGTIKNRNGHFRN